MKVQPMYIGKPKQRWEANAMDMIQQVCVSAINRDYVDGVYIEVSGFNEDEAEVRRLS